MTKEEYKERKIVTSTCNNTGSEINIEDIKRCADFITKKKENPLPKGTRWVNLVMARLGWHRKYEIIVIDKSRLGSIFHVEKKIDAVPNDYQDGWNACIAEAERMRDLSIK